MKNVKGTDFQKMVWSEIKKIPKGKTCQINFTILGQI